jgi:hypothetical protein
MQEIQFIKEFQGKGGVNGLFDFLGKKYTMVALIEYDPTIVLIPKHSHILIEGKAYTIWEVFTDIKTGLVTVIVSLKIESTQL